MLICRSCQAPGPPKHVVEHDKITPDLHCGSCVVVQRLKGTASSDTRLRQGHGTGHRALSTGTGAKHKCLDRARVHIKRAGTRTGHGRWTQSLSTLRQRITFASQPATFLSMINPRPDRLAPARDRLRDCTRTSSHLLEAAQGQMVCGRELGQDASSCSPGHLQVRPGVTQEFWSLVSASASFLFA